MMPRNDSTIRLAAQVLLAGAYAPDRHSSMERYARLLHEGLAEAGVQVQFIEPQVFFGRLPGLPARLRKGAAFLDKYLLFPRALRRKLANMALKGPVVVHLLDQGNALYARGLSHRPVVVTCHDLIAARAALAGSEHASGRKLGRWFHRRNLSMMQGADAVVGDSQKTLEDCRMLFDPANSTSLLKRVHLPVDPVFLAAAPAGPRSSPQPFLMHVGNSAWYKNRLGLFRIYAALRHIMPGAPSLVLYGEGLQARELEAIRDLDIETHVTCHSRSSDRAIRTAYSQAEALIFPSLEEGFGWPPLEALASGCPVFASNFPPLTEIAGDAAEYFDPHQPEAAAALIASRLSTPGVWREERAASGRRRAAEFTVGKFISEMIQVYEEILDRAGSGTLRFHGVKDQPSIGSPAY